jgi:hypothetical protein
MSTTFNFSDRFSYPADNGVTSDIDFNTAQTLVDADLEAVSPELAEMGVMVRRYSVLLQRTSLKDIFNIIVQDSDPRIALVLAAAKSKVDNTPLFGGLDAVKELMYADPDRPGLTLFTNRNLFSDGIRRVSAALTASRLIGQLAQVKEQAAHADIIEKQAIEDLDRIVLTWETSRLSQLSDTEKEELPPTAFYFEPGTWELPPEKELYVEWQSPSIQRDWTLVGVYSNTFETWQVVSAIVDDINAKTVFSTDSPLLATAELSGDYVASTAIPNPSLYHLINFYPRRPIPGVVAYSINLKIEIRLKEGQTDTSSDTFPVNRTPFIWGRRAAALNRYNCNGSIIVIRNNKLSGSSNRSEQEDYEPFVLYFKNGVDYSGVDVPPPQDGKLVFRVEPWQPNLSPIDPDTGEHIETIEVDIPRLIAEDPDEQVDLDNSRFSQVALAMLNALASLNLDTRVTGALIRNDPYSASDAAAAMELVPWSKQRVIIAVVLDVLEVPPDILLATGDRMRVLTLYSNKPRSILVKNPQSDQANGVVDAVMKKEQTHVIKRRRPNLWTSILDEATVAEQRGWS